MLVHPYPTNSLLAHISRLFRLLELLWALLCIHVFNCFPFIHPTSPLVPASPRAHNQTLTLEKLFTCEGPQQLAHSSPTPIQYCAFWSCNKNPKSVFVVILSQYLPLHLLVSAKNITI